MRSQFDQELEDRLVRYARIDTQADESSPTSPSTVKQYDLLHLLEAELKKIGAQDITLTAYGALLATVPATVSHNAPAIAFLAHVDTAPGFNATGVKPIIHRGYDGGVIRFPDDSELVLSPQESPYLAGKVGDDIITASGTTLLGADVISAITKTLSGLGGLIFMFLMIAQFIAYFNYTNIPRVLAVNMAQALEQASVGALPLLVGLIIVIFLLNLIIPGVVPKWAIFAPVFIPIFDRLGVAPQTVLAAYRIGDSPFNVLTPLMVYLAFVVTVAQRYQKDAGIGTVVSLMLPYTLIIAAVWILLFVLWFVLGIPLGPGYPVGA